MSDLQTPERAIEAFEQLTGLRVCLRDACGSIQPWIAPKRIWHSGPYCAMAKSGPEGWRCHAFEGRHLDRELVASHREGRIHQCHAGLVEWVLPVLDEEELVGVLFAGQRSAGPDFEPAIRQPASGVKFRRRPPRVDARTAALFLEALRQLGSRLLLWHRQQPAYVEIVSRESRIRHFLRRQSHRPLTIDDLAAVLHLSPSRTAHVVREVTGRTWHDLLTRARIRTATDLLRHTDLPVAEIALRCGFGDQSTFQRAFRRSAGTTPGRFRKDPEALLSSPGTG